MKLWSNDVLKYERSEPSRLLTLDQRLVTVAHSGQEMCLSGPGNCLRDPNARALRRPKNVPKSPLKKRAEIAPQETCRNRGIAKRFGVDPSTVQRSRASTDAPQRPSLLSGSVSHVLTKLFWVGSDLQDARRQSPPRKFVLKANHSTPQLQPCLFRTNSIAANLCASVAIFCWPKRTSLAVCANSLRFLAAYLAWWRRGVARRSLNNSISWANNICSFAPNLRIRADLRASRGRGEDTQDFSRWATRPTARTARRHSTSSV
jgi:hypothetical protein